MIDSYKEDDYIKEFNEGNELGNYIKMQNEPEIDLYWEDPENFSQICRFIDALHDTDLKDPEYENPAKDYLCNIHQIIANHVLPNLPEFQEFEIPNLINFLLTELMERKSVNKELTQACFSIAVDITRSHSSYISDLLAGNYLNVSQYFITNAHRAFFSLRRPQNQKLSSINSVETQIIISYINILINPVYGYLIGPEIAKTVVQRYLQSYDFEHAQYLQTFIAHYIAIANDIQIVINEIHNALRIWLDLKLGYETYYTGNILYQLIIKGYIDKSNVEPKRISNWIKISCEECPIVCLKVISVLLKNVPEAFNSKFLRPANVGNLIVEIIQQHHDENTLRQAYYGLEMLVSHFPTTIREYNHKEVIINSFSILDELPFQAKNAFYEYFIEVMLHLELSEMPEVDFSKVISELPEQISSSSDKDSVDIYVRFLLKIESLIRGNLLYDVGIMTALNEIKDDVIDILDDMEETDNINTLLDLLSNEPE